MEAIIDDLAARKCADYLNIPISGTLGIVKRMVLDLPEGHDY